MPLFAIAIIIKNGGTFFSIQKECKAIFQEKGNKWIRKKMQESGQFEIGGALGRANRITTLIFFLWTTLLCVHVTCKCTLYMYM